MNSIQAKKAIENCIPTFFCCCSLSHGAMSHPAMSPLATSLLAMFYSSQCHPTMPPQCLLKLHDNIPPNTIHPNHLPTTPIFLDGVLKLHKLDSCPDFELIYFFNLSSTLFCVWTIEKN